MMPKPSYSPPHTSALPMQEHESRPERAAYDREVQRLVRRLDTAAGRARDATQDLARAFGLADPADTGEETY